MEGGIEIPLRKFIGGDEALVSFFEDRVKIYFKDIRGFKYDEVNAAMAADWSNLVDLEARLDRIRNLRTTPDFEPLAASFKRIRNILEQAKFTGGGAFDESLLEAGPRRIYTTNTGALPASRSKTRFPGCGPRSTCSSTRCW